MYDIKFIGQKCMEFRKETGMSQTDVARDLGCAQFNISRFERGLNNSAMILLWYLFHGMSLNDLKGSEK